mmetsp:Transcript_3733/g.6521  ORF Transcript_3733/g.6521 Transcript_3733/m.6521 type:complete len:153 (+) Transcript_3733:86-544(+)
MYSNTNIFTLCVQEDLYIRGQTNPHFSLVSRARKNMAVDSDGVRSFGNLTRRCFFWRGRAMTRIVVLLDLIHETLSEGGILSLRDIYYSFGDLFSVQAQSNAAVLDIAATLRTTRRNLHIHAGGDGFVSGLCNLSFPGLDSVDCTRLTEVSR